MEFMFWCLPRPGQLIWGADELLAKQKYNFVVLLCFGGYTLGQKLSQHLKIAACWSFCKKNSTAEACSPPRLLTKWTSTLETAPSFLTCMLGSISMVTSSSMRAFLALCGNCCWSCWFCIRYISVGTEKCFESEIGAVMNLQRRVGTIQKIWIGELELRFRFCI